MTHRLTRLHIVVVVRGEKIRKCAGWKMPVRVSKKRGFQKGKLTS